MLWYLVEVPQQGTSDVYPQHMLSEEIRKISSGYPVLARTV